MDTEQSVPANSFDITILSVLTTLFQFFFSQALYNKYMIKAFIDIFPIVRNILKFNTHIGTCIDKGTGC